MATNDATTATTTATTTASPVTASSRTFEKAKITMETLEKKYSRENLVQKAQVKAQCGDDESEYAKLLKSRMSATDFEKIRVIGRGAFGEVCLTRKRDTGSIYAMKKLKKSEMLRKNQTRHVRAERQILGAADNPWIVELHFSFQDDDFLYLVMEFLPGGDLMTWLMDKQIFTEEESRFYLAELVLAVESIHKMNYVHRDLKPDNILLDSQGHIKLSDFGLCKPFEGNTPVSAFTAPDVVVNDGRSSRELREAWRMSRSRELMFSTVGSPGYIAPEVLLKNGYLQECDWWSVGVIMFEMICGYPPFYADDAMQTCHKIVRWREFLQIPESELSADAIDLLRRFLTDAQTRIGSQAGGVQDIKSHAFFKNVDWENIRTVPAPFQPELGSEIDTAYFDEFEDTAAATTTTATGEGGEGANKNTIRKVSNKNKDSNYLFDGYTFRKDTAQKLRKQLRDAFGDNSGSSPSTPRTPREEDPATATPTTPTTDA